jgi:hypothetical protein
MPVSSPQTSISAKTGDGAECLFTCSSTGERRRRRFADALFLELTLTFAPIVGLYGGRGKAIDDAPLRIGF